MKKRSLIYLLIWTPFLMLAQQQSKNMFKKKVLQSTQINLLSSIYTQSGKNAAVTGGIGNESLQDAATNIDVSIPVNADDVLTIDGTVSAYTSASSGNLNPFTGASRSEDNKTGASQGGGNDDEGDDEGDDDRPSGTNQSPVTTNGPWGYSSAPSRQDVWLNGVFSYSHTSDDRNKIISGKLSIANEFDYFSFGTGFNFTHLFNNKNTEFGWGGMVYFDKWRPQYPTEIKMFILNNGNLKGGFFNGVNIYNQSGYAINKSGSNLWQPAHPNFITKKGRNTYTLSLSFSQILSKNAQFSVFSDITYQHGQLGNPMQRVYFADKPNYYIGNPADIPNYTNPKNTSVFQLADDFERFPVSRLKIPIGLRFHYFINEKLVLRTYYRYYFDDWGMMSNTFNVELPIKLNDRFTIYPNYRFYNQTASKYFAPYEKHLSTEKYYTSDYDLSAYNANQFGFGIKYHDIFTKSHIFNFGIKNVSLNYNYYQRSSGFKAHIVSVGLQLVLDK